MSIEKPTNKFEAPVEHWWKASLVGGLTVLPIALAISLGAPAGAILALLSIVVVVLLIVVFRRRTRL